MTHQRFHVRSFDPASGTPGQVPTINDDGTALEYRDGGGGAHYSATWHVAAAGDNLLTLGAEPVADSLQVFRNGLLLQPDVDYTYDSDTRKALFATPSVAGDVVSDRYATITEAPPDSTLAGASYLDVVLADNPLAYYRLGEASGTVMADSSGNARAGTYTGGPTLGVVGALAGDADTAATFNGTSQYGLVPYAAWMNPGSVSLEAWVKTTDTDGIVIGRNNAFGEPYYLRVSSTLGAYFQIQSTAGGFFVNATTPSIRDGAWHHVVATYDAATGVLNLYIDGALAATKAVTAAPLLTRTDAFTIGRRGDGSYYAGTADEVAIYGAALSSTRPNAHYQAGITAP